jgi:hypothetical protein
MWASADLGQEHGDSLGAPRQIVSLKVVLLSLGRLVEDTPDMAHVEDLALDSSPFHLQVGTGP